MAPEFFDFFATLDTRCSRRRIAALFAPPTWSVRKCGWTDYEVISTFAELVIEADSPILLHGLAISPSADVEATIDRILALLRAAGIGYTAECYNSTGSLIGQWHEEPG